jgi:Uma2 family endonuclease
MPNGMSVRVDNETVYEPDALVYCGPRVPNGTMFIENPVVVVEVISPASEAVDTGEKLVGYFGFRASPTRHPPAAARGHASCPRDPAT